MKKIIFLALFSISISAIAQSKYLTKTGQLNFEASVPSFEEVAAKNESVTAILNTENGEFAALALVKGFRFKNALMEEHFNENYIESSKYPKAIFKGKIENFDVSKLNEKEQKFTINGTLELHGKTKNIVSIALIKKSGNTIIIDNTFTVKPEDFDIKIPSVVSQKVAKTVDVSCHFSL